MARARQELAADTNTETETEEIAGVEIYHKELLNLRTGVHQSRV